MKFRHRVARWVVPIGLAPYCKLKYHIDIVKFKEQGKRPYLILYNHQTGFDQFFVALSFQGPVYYLATEDIFSMGWVSSLIRWLVEPIPIKKQTTDLTAVKTCLRVAKEGGTLCIAPEGNRTYSGRTEYMGSGIASLAKKLKLPIALYRIEGGYGVQPRWSDVVRKGKMKGYVSRVIEPEEIEAMTAEELFKEIETGLYVDENKADGSFLSEKRGEFLERALYVCPFCGLTTLESHGCNVTCKTCGATVTYNQDKTLTGVGCDFPYTFVGEWYDAQKKLVNGLDLTQMTQTPCYTETVSVWEVELNKKKTCLNPQTTLKLYGDRLALMDMILPFDDLTAVSVLGKNKLNVYYKDKVWQVRGDKRFNALKYVNFYYRYQNIVKGEENGEFLGL